MNKKLLLVLLLFSLTFAVGCRTAGRGNSGQVQSFVFQPVEAEWIRNGEPIVFEGETWYPKDDIESLQDSEVYYLGEYRSVQFFVDRVDVRPYDRLYTKFAKNKFRFYKKRKQAEE